MASNRKHSHWGKWIKERIKLILQKEIIRIYIACPFTHLNPIIEKRRYQIATRITAKILDNFPKIIPFSPLTYTYYLATEVETNVNWYKIDLEFLADCDYLLVLKVDGWKESYGVKLEIETAHEKRIPIIYSNPENVIETLRNMKCA